MAQEKYHAANPVVGFLVRRFFERIAGVLAHVGPRSVLDAGCGEGELLRRGILGAAFSVVPLDRSREALAELRTYAAGCPLVCGSLLQLPFGPGTFDAALCLEVLEHLDNPAVAVRELLRVTRRAVVLSVPYEPYFQMGNLLRGKYLNHAGNHPEHVQHWNMRRFRGFIEPLVGETPWRIQIIEAFPWIIACCRHQPKP